MLLTDISTKFFMCAYEISLHAVEIDKKIPLWARNFLTVRGTSTFLHSTVISVPTAKLEIVTSWFGLTHSSDYIPRTKGGKLGLETASRSKEDVLETRFPRNRVWLK